MMATEKTYSAFVECDRWEEFVQFSKEAGIVVYNIRLEEGALHVYAIKRRVFAYKETLPFPQKAEITKNESEWKFKNCATDDEKQPKNTSGLVVFSRQHLQKKLACGIPYSVIPKLNKEGNNWTIEFKCEFNPEKMAEFLSETLKVSRDKVIEGDVCGL